MQRCLLVLLAVTALPLAAALTPAEARGKQIFLRGASPSGTPVTASFGGDGNELPGETFACANCHGPDGRGKPEGDVTPSNIRWRELTKSYSPEREDGRKYPPYTERSLKRAITLGLDPAGQVLNPVMPRFHMAWQDLDDLVAYLKKLEDDIDPGLSATSISIGVLLPPARLQAMANAIRAVLEAYVLGVNQEGGIFGRKLELRYFNAPSRPENQAAALRDFIHREQLFALTASYLVQAEAPDSRVLAEEQAPLVGAFTLLPFEGVTVNRYLFYLDGGLPDEIEALVDWAFRKRGAEGTAFILGAGDQKFDGLAENVFRKHGWKSVRLWRKGDALDSAAVILCLNGDAGAAILGRAALTSQPLILVPGSLQVSALMDLPGAAQGRVAVASSWRPGQESEGAELYRKLATAHQLPSAHIQSQFFALASIRTLVEGLKRSGRELSRDKLVQSLDGLYQFRNGITPPLTFTPGRRVGSQAARIFLASP